MLRERYEQIRERVLQPTGIRVGSDVAMQRGMRSWMEAGWREEISPLAPALAAGGPRVEPAFQQVVAIWAGVLVDQAERSYGGPREA